MELICLSISHHNAPVELRECLSLPADTIASAYSQSPIRKGLFIQVHEMVILSTCNRLEVYAVVEPGEEMGVELADPSQPLLNYLEQVFEIPAGRAIPFFRHFIGPGTVEHLYRVTAGLDSIAIGETQILGQVSRALDAALRLGSARHILSSLFRAAINTGKRVRTETEIGRHPTSISSLAIQLAEAASGGLAQRKVMVIGAGKMGGTTLEALRERKAGDIVLLNRTYSHAEAVAEKYGISAMPFERLVEGLSDADIVFTSTAAPLPILKREMIAETMLSRPDRPLILVDLAVPRNVDTKARDIPGVQLYDMDDLQTFAKSAPVRSRDDILRAEAIVAEETSEYEKLLRIIPFIGELHKKVEEIRQREVEKTLRHLRTSDPQVAEQVELLSRSLVRKILHDPTMHLRTEADQETLNDYVDTLARLFDLGEIEPAQRAKESQAWEQ